MQKNLTESQIPKEIVKRLPIPLKNNNFNAQSDRNLAVFSELSLASSPFRGGGGNSARNNYE
jgi:hypothetical protein